MINNKNVLSNSSHMTHSFLPHCGVYLKVFESIDRVYILIYQYFDTQWKYLSRNQVLRKLVKHLNSQNVNVGIVAKFFAYESNMGRRFCKNRVPYLTTIQGTLQFCKVSFFRQKIQCCRKFCSSLISLELKVLRFLEIK